MTSDPIRSPTDRRGKTSLPICLQPASPQYVGKSRVPGKDWHANGIKRETAVGQRASDVTLPVFLQLVVRRSERTSRQHGVCQRRNTVNTLQINFKSHDARAWVSCNEKPEVRTVLIPFWERLKQDVWTRMDSPSSFFFPILLPPGGFEAVECCSAYFFLME